MGHARLEALQEMLAEDPQDAFARYGLAMELRSLDQRSQALTHFAQLMGEQPEYLATYYQYASLLHGEGQNERAIEVVRQGITAAGKASDAHTVSELEDLLEDFSG